MIPIKRTFRILISVACAGGVCALIATQACGGGTRRSGLATDAKVETVRLWEGDAPGAKGKTDADIPTLTIYRPAEKSNGASVVICPGGGYGFLAPHEGKPIAEWLNTLGVTGLVLTYRIAPRYHHPAMLTDVNRAIRSVRAHAAEWKLDSDRIGILGFSAGGHLASTGATHFDAGDANASDLVERVSSRPDFAILIYPVITLTEPYAHLGSRANLLGEHPAPELVEKFSNEKQVTPKTPPTFLVHGTDDSGVPCENSLLFAAACRKAGVPVELHLYEHGPHGFGLGSKEMNVGTWSTRCGEWMQARGLLKPIK